MHTVSIEAKVQTLLEAMKSELRDSVRGRVTEIVQQMVLEETAKVMARVQFHLIEDSGAFGLPRGVTIRVEMG